MVHLTEKYVPLKLDSSFDINDSCKISILLWLMQLYKLFRGVLKYWVHCFNMYQRKPSVIKRRENKEMSLYLHQPFSDVNCSALIMAGTIRRLPLAKCMSLPASCLQLAVPLPSWRLSSQTSLFIMQLITISLLLLSLFFLIVSSSVMTSIHLHP